MIRRGLLGRWMGMVPSNTVGLGIDAWSVLSISIANLKRGSERQETHRPTNAWTLGLTSQIVRATS